MSQSSFSLAIAGIEILQDIEGRYNLNILHKASGGAPKHRPGLWVRTDSAKSLVSEVEKTSAQICALVTVVGGISPGTFATQELVVAYAAWISAPFHLKVIRIFLDEAERIRGMSTVDRLVESALALQRHERRIAELAQQQVELKTEINLRQDRMEGEFERLTGMLTQMTVKGYAKAVAKRSISNAEAIAMGRKVASISRDMGLPIGKVVDSLYGEINCYDQEALEKGFVQ